LKSNNLDIFEAEMLRLNWKLETIYADEESLDGVSTLSMLYPFDEWYIWCMFKIYDRDLDSYQLDVTSGVSYYEYNEFVKDVLQLNEKLDVKNAHFRTKDTRWMFHGVVGSKVFAPQMSDLIIEWAKSIDISLWLQHIIDAEGTRFDERLYAATWYGRTDVIEKKISDLTKENKSKYGVITIDMLKKALEISRSRSSIYR